MKFIVSSAALLKKLQMIGGVINNTNTLPILDNILFEINGNTLTLTASDLETTFAAKIDVESETNSIIALPARLLLDTLKTFPEQPLTFLKTEKNTVEISANNGKYAVAYVEGEEFPKAAQVSDAKTTQISGSTLYTAINSTLFASGNDDLRPVMSGVFFQFSSESLTFVATDAHKLVKYTRTDLSVEETAEFIMPKKPLQLLRGILPGYGRRHYYRIQRYQCTFPLWRLYINLSFDRRKIPQLRGRNSLKKIRIRCKSIGTAS